MGSASSQSGYQTQRLERANVLWNICHDDLVLSPIPIRLNVQKVVSGDLARFKN